VSKRLAIIVGLAVLLTFVFATAAFAAQVKVGPVNDDVASYLPTVKQYTYDNATDYPYEIYLPNEANPENYRIHTNYTKDTDACASCHATHTAVGASLLQWYSAYDTCMACHDGTVTTTYNVQEGLIGSTGKATFGGMFGNGTEAFGSNHNVTGALNISAAPGGSAVAETGTTEYGKTVTAWQAEFGCQSCHSPHGQGGNARILNPDPNGAATLRKPAGGFAYTATVDATTTGLVYEAGVGYKVYFEGEPALLIKGYPYGANVYDDGSKSWGATVDNSAGYTVISGVDLSDDAADRVYGTPAIQVKMDIDNYLQANESVTHISGLNNFCGACHTDYNTSAFTAEGSAETLTGKYSEAYRHQVGMNWHADEPGLDFEENYRVTCETCHVAHGTNQDYWDRTVGPSGSGEFALAQLKEIAGSSALKRKPNMGVCETCHSKGEGNEGYAVLSGQAAVTPDTQTKNGEAYFPAGYQIDANGKLVSAALEIQPDGTLSKTGDISKDLYVGSQTCANCHADYAAEYQKYWKDDFVTVVTEAVYNNWAANTQAANLVRNTDIYWSDTELQEWLDETLHAKKIMPVEKRVATAADLVNVGLYGNTTDAQAAIDGGAVYYAFTSIRPEAMARWNENDMATSDLYPNDVDYVLGGKWKQRYVFAYNSANNSSGKDKEIYDASVAEAGAPAADGLVVATGTIQFNTDLYGDGTDQSWVDYNGGKAYKDWLTGCGSCHATGIDVTQSGVAPAAGFDPLTSEQYYKEQGVGCEACHGPGKNHAEFPTAENIINPAEMPLGQQTDVCGSCHIRGKSTAGRGDTYGWLPGTEYSINRYYKIDLYDSGTFSYTTYEADGSTYSSETAGMELVDTTKLWADNTSKGHHQQYIDFIQSGHYQAAGGPILSCSSCHDSHKLIDAKQLKARADALCATCHGQAVNIDAYMPFVAKSAQIYSNGETNGGGDIRSHVFKEDYQYTESGTPIDNPSLD